MKFYLISDTHFNHTNIATYCDRPANFTELLIQRWQGTVKSEDTVIHLGDVLIGKRQVARELIASLPGRKILVRGNHDQQGSCSWWIDNGFDFACDGMVFRNCWLTHKPSPTLPEGCELNLHGHWHNIWHGFKPDNAGPVEHKEWHRLFSVEYTDYRPVEFQKFVYHPERYQCQRKWAKV